MGSGLSVEVVGEMRPPLEILVVMSSWRGEEAALELVPATEMELRAELLPETGVVMGTVMVEDPMTADEEAAALAAAVAAAMSKLQRTPACKQREQEGLMRSQRRLKWRQRSHVLTSRICGMAGWKELTSLGPPRKQGVGGKIALSRQWQCKAAGAPHN